MSDETERAEGSSEAGKPDEQPFDAGDQHQVNQRNRSLKREEIRRREFLRRAMQDQQGREWLWHLLDICHMNATSFHTDPRMHAFLEGERNIGLQVNADLMRYPAEFLLMLKENGGKA